MTAAEPAPTTYAGTRRISDADSHLMESPDWLRQHVAADMRDRFQTLDLESFGDFGRKAKEMFASIEESHNDPARIEELEANVMSSGKGWQALGAWSPPERSRALDLLGFDLQLVFPTFSVMQYITSRDIDVVYEGARAQNAGMAEFCSDDDRLLPVAFVPLKDLERAEKLIDNEIDQGAPAVWLTTGPPGGVSPSHPDVDRIWARLSEAGIPFLLHVGGGNDMLHPAFHDNGRPREPEQIRSGEPINASDFPQIHHNSTNFLTCMILDGVFERFPELRAGVIEVGASWVPGWLRTLDFSVSQFARTERRLTDLSLTPTEYAQRQIRFTPFAFEDAGWLIEQTGADLFMFSTDYPHPEGTRTPLERFDASLSDADIDGDVVERFMWRNFADLMGIDTRQ